MRKPQRDLSDAPFSEVLLALPRIGVAGFLIGFIGSWVKPVDNVVTIVDRLQFGALIAACFAVMIPVILLCLKLWNWMWARAGF